MLVSNLPILSRASIMEIKGMMQLHGGGRMEEKYNMCDTHVCGRIAMHSTERTVKNKVRFSQIEFAMRQTCVRKNVKGHEISEFS